jgi:hypothetical protein
MIFIHLTTDTIQAWLDTNPTVFIMAVTVQAPDIYILYK